MERIAIIGLGLIGGSIGLALKQQQLENMEAQEFEQLLDTKPEAPDPFFLFLEDVEALKKLGLTPTKNVFIVRDENDLTELFEQIRRP